MKSITRDEFLNPFLIFAELFRFHGIGGLKRCCYVNSIFLIEGGSGSLQMYDRTIPMEAHTLVYVPPLAVHTWHSDAINPLVFRCAYFDWRFTERPLVKHRNDLIIKNPTDPIEFNPDYVSPILDIDIQNPIRIDNYPYWHQLFVSFSNNYDVLHDYSQEASLDIQSKFNRMLKHLLAYTQQKTRHYDPRIKEVISFMEHSVEYEPIYQIVRKIGLSRSYFQTLFKNQLNATPKQFWNQIRINKAKDDLKNSSLSITEIADKYKFSSVHYFSKMFKSQTGETPSSFRNKNYIF